MTTGVGRRKPSAGRVLTKSGSDGVLLDAKQCSTPVEGVTGKLSVAAEDASWDSDVDGGVTADTDDDDSSGSSTVIGGCTRFLRDHMSHRYGFEVARECSYVRE